MWYGAAGLLALGALFATLTLWVYRRKARFVATAVPADGTVVRLEDRADSEHGRTFAPVVEFQAEGATHTFTSAISSSPPSYQPGDRVVVLYAPGRPDDAMIDSWAGRYLVVLVLAIFAVTTLITGGVLVVVAQGQGGA